jgi:hypothetical protein
MSQALAKPTAIVVATVLFSTLAAAHKQEFPADPKAIWTTSCQEEIERRIRASRPQAERIQALEDSMKEWQESANKTGVSGGGQFVGGKGKANRFVFQCFYSSDVHDLTSSNWHIRE